MRSKLSTLARLTMWRYRPGIVGITGSVGKTSTKLAIAAVLSSGRTVRYARGNLNNELGLALTILGDWREDELRLVSRDFPAGKSKLRKTFFWLKVIFVSAYHIVRKVAYPEILVLEYGADRPGDIRALLRIAKPNVSVITAVGDIPVHVEYYSGPDDVAREKARLIEQLPSAGYAIVNHDDLTVMHLADRTRGHVMTFGFGKGADVQVTRFENRVEDGRPAGVSFKLEHEGTFVPVRLANVFGKVQGYASVAAAAVGFVFGMNLVKISEALAGYRGAPHRMELIPGIKDTLVIDDSYNASPLSMDAALDTLRDLPGARKVAILGDMLEIGKYAIEAHEALGRQVAEFADALVTVGPRAKFIAETARAAKMPKNAVISFDDAESAIHDIKSLVKKGDLILVKGSHAMQLNTMVDGLRAIPFSPA